MNENQKNQLWRIPVFVSGIIAIVYLAIYLFTGNIPEVKELILFKDPKDCIWGLPQILILPFAYSRLWDILFGFILSFLFVYLIIKIKNMDNKELKGGLVYGLAIGLVVGLVFGLVFGLVYGLVFGLVYGLVFGLGALKSSLKRKILN